VIPCWGWQTEWAEDVVFALNRWNWYVKPDDVERFKSVEVALFEAENRIVVVAEINDVIPGPKDGRYSLVGRALTAGPVRDRWIGQPSPVSNRTRGGVDFYRDVKK
jgi:hypothetical protein